MNGFAVNRIIDGRSPWRVALAVLSASLVLFLGAWVGGRVSASQTADSYDESIEALLSTMSLEERVGQLFMIHAYGASLFDSNAANIEGNRALHGLDSMGEVIETFRPGGFVYFNFTNNVESPEQLARLSNELQRLALETGAGIPLLIGIDQEHGVVRRIGPPVTEFPGSMALGATGVEENAYRAAYVAGVELRMLGVNVNFAPVADVNINPRNPIIGTRSFGDDPAEVSRYVAAQVRGFREGGIAATAKHFPGHGDTDVDSHTGLPLIGHSRAVFEAVDLPPFQAAIDAGVDLIMTAHILVPAFDDSGRPATLSYAILTELLREQMGFTGVIVTDALTMDGVRQGIEPARIAVEALKAGADILLMPEQLAVAYHAVLEAVETGELSEERIDASVRRILRLKGSLGLFNSPWVDEGLRTEGVGSDEHRTIARQIARESVTLVRGGDGSLPLDKIAPERTWLLVTGWGEATIDTLGRALQEGGLQTIGIPTGVNPSDDTVERIAVAARHFDHVIVVAFNADNESRQGQRTLIERLAKEGNRVIVLGVGLPYEAGVLPEGVTYLALYGYRPVSLEAAVDVLLGKSAPVGQLPVQVFIGD